MGSADCLVTFHGFEQNKHAVEWLSQGRVRELWIVRMKDSPLVEFGIIERGSDACSRVLLKSGVPESRIRVLRAESTESGILPLLQEIGKASDRFAAQQVVIACSALEPRLLREIADAALPPHQAGRLRFVPLPHAEYTATSWWLSRSGWKAVYQSSLGMLENAYFGPTSGFDPSDWNPDEWEARTFPHTSPALP